MLSLIHIFHGVATIMQTGVYLLVPYLLTTFSGLWIIRKIRGKETIYGCMAAAVVISGLNLILRIAVPKMCIRDRDGTVDIIDLIRIQKHILGIQLLS